MYGSEATTALSRERSRPTKLKKISSCKMLPSCTAKVGKNELAEILFYYISQPSNPFF